MVKWPLTSTLAFPGSLTYSSRSVATAWERTDSGNEAGLQVVKNNLEKYERIRTKSDLGHLWEVVVYEMWSEMEARLYFFDAISRCRAVCLIILSSS